MGKKTKEKSLDLYYLNKEEKKKNTKKSSKTNRKNNKIHANKNDKVKDESTKDETFNFDEEIIIGLKKIEDEPAHLPSKKKNQKRKNKEKNVKNAKNVKTVQQAVKVETKPKEKQVQNKKVKKKKVEKKLTPKQELARKKRKVIFRLVKWTSLILIMIGAIIYTIMSPIFNVKNINVTGNSKLSSDQIISLSKIEIEKNMFQYHESKIIESIKENAYVDTVQVKRKLPDTIELIISERKATYTIQVANAYAMIDNQGHILEISNERNELPTIVGIETNLEEVIPGNRLCVSDLKKLGDVLKIMESATSNGIDNLITKIDITDSDNYKLILQKKKKTVHLGDISNLSTKMLLIIKFNELEGDTQGEIMINMNLNDEKNNPYFRKSV